MRLAIQVAVALAVLFVLVLVGLAVLLPRLAASEAVRVRLEETARSVTGQEVRWDELAFGLLPPRLVVLNPKVAPPGTPSEPSLEADSVSLRVALLPLLTRTVVIDSLVVEGVTVRLRRTAEGVQLPLDRAGDAAPRSEEAAPDVPAEDEDGVALAVRDVRLLDSRLLLEDRTVEPPLVWDLVDLEARAKGSSLAGPIAVELSGKLATGGTVHVEGTAWLDGRIDLDATLDQLALEPLQRYVDALGLVLGGRVSARAAIEGGIAKVWGPFEVDATGAELIYGEAFQKPRGTPATVTGRLTLGREGALALEDVNLRMHSLDARGRVETGRWTRVELEAPPFDLSGWGDLVPALASFAPEGSVALEKLAIKTTPLDLRGRVILRDLLLTPATGEPIGLHGTLEGIGGAVRSRNLEAVVGEQRIALDVELSDLAKEPRYRVVVRTEQAEANALLTALAGMDDTLYGPLTGNAELSGPVGGARPPLEALGGRARLEIGRGRLRGVSLLRGSLERLGAFGEAALLAGEIRGGKTLQRFYEDEFESISGTFVLGNGRAKTDDLHMVYRHYRVDLRGSVGMLDESLDLSGTLTIDEEVDAALAAGVDQEATPVPASPRVIPLAHLGGTVREPHVKITREAAVELVASYALDRLRESLEHKIDERLGEGAGREILSTLEQILGGKKKKSEEP